MNNISLLAPSLEMWGAVFTMSCFAYLVTHRNTLGEAAGRYLTPLELNLSLLLICSPAVGLLRTRTDLVPEPVFLFFRILTELLRINQVLLSAGYISHHLPEDRFTRRVMRFSTVLP